MRNYMILNKIDEQGNNNGEQWFINGLNSPIAAMQLLCEGQYNQRTLIYLKGGANILTVKETPQEIIEMENNILNK